MKKLQVLGLAAGLLLATSAVFANTTFTGQTGNVALPTAEITPYGVLVLTADYQNTNNIQSVEGNTGALFLTLGVVDNVEVGVGYRSLQIDVPGPNGTKADTMSANAKFLTPIRLLGFDWSASANYGVTHKYGINPDDIKTTQVAWVGDQKFKIGEYTMATGTIGVNWTEKDLGAAGAPHAVRYFAGVSVPLVANVTALGDYQTASKNLDQKALYGLAIAYQAAKDFTIKGGISNAYPTSETIGAGQAKPFLAVNVKFNSK